MIHINPPLQVGNSPEYMSIYNYLWKMADYLNVALNNLTTESSGESVQSGGAEIDALRSWAVSEFAKAIHSHTKSDITDFSHNHVKADITDFAHSHTKSDISDWAHTHPRSEITNFTHSHPVSQIDGWTEAMALKEDAANKVTAISAASTDTQYPSAKAVYQYIQTEILGGEF